MAVAAINPSTTAKVIPSCFAAAAKYPRVRISHRRFRSALKWRKRSPIKIMVQTHVEATEVLHDGGARRAKKKPLGNSDRGLGSA